MEHIYCLAKRVQVNDIPQSRLSGTTAGSFKGMESDVVILCGIDGKLPGCSPANLYVGATRARVMLQVIRKKGVEI